MLAQWLQASNSGYRLRYILVRDKGIVLALVELVAAGGIQFGDAERQRLHIRFPALALCMQLIHDIFHINGHGVIIGNAICRS